MTAFVRVNGIDLRVDVVGEGRPLLLLHGFTGGVETWAPFMPILGAIRRAIAVDLIGHGRSDAPADPERYRMERCVEDLLALLHALDAPEADVLGYSMGGRVALHLAVAAPERVGTLIIESGSPGLAGPAEREDRTASDNALADAIDREGLEAFVDRWERVPLFGSQSRLPPEVRARLRAQRLQGNPVGLANSLRGLGTGRQASLWDRLPGLDGPTLLIAGALDPRYRDVARRMAEVMPSAEVIIVPDAGHATHLEQPAAFADAVTAHLRAWRPRHVTPAGQ